jgi:hypothetical protein
MKGARVVNAAKAMKSARVVKVVRGLRAAWATKATRVVASALMAVHVSGGDVFSS